MQRRWIVPCRRYCCRLHEPSGVYHSEQADAAKFQYLKIKRGKALELGAGTPKDSAFLLKEGFKVTAVDIEPSSEENFKKLSIWWKWEHTT